MSLVQHLKFERRRRTASKCTRNGAKGSSCNSGRPEKRYGWANLYNIIYNLCIYNTCYDKGTSFLLTNGTMCLIDSNEPWREVVMLAQCSKSQDNDLPVLQCILWKVKKESSSFAAYNAPIVYVVHGIYCTQRVRMTVWEWFWESISNLLVIRLFFSVAVVLPLSIPLAAPPTQKNTTLL